MGWYGQCSDAQSYVACTGYCDLNIFKITHIFLFDLVFSILYYLTHIHPINSSQIEIFDHSH